MNRNEFYKKYYGDPAVRNFIEEQFSDADFAVGSGPVLVERKWSFPIKVVPRENLSELLNDGLDIYRPVVSAGESFYIFWDMEYFNRDHRSYVYKNQAEVFERMEPYVKKVREVLASYGVKYILDATASGWHLWMKISKKSDAFRKLASCGFLTETIKQKYFAPACGDIKRVRKISLEEAAAYDCAGKILEFLTLKLKGSSSLALSISDVPPPGGFEGFSSDITQYAHPMFMRAFRACGSLHQKNVMFYGGELPAIDVVRRNGDKLEDIIRDMWSVERALLRIKSSVFPLEFSDDGFEKIFEEYKNSPLASFHKEFESLQVQDSADTTEMPEEIALYFTREKANPSLLDPVVLKKIVDFYTNDLRQLKRVLAKIKNLYENEEYNWWDPVKMRGINWKKYDASQAVHFWGRVFYAGNKAGLF